MQQTIQAESRLQSTKSAKQQQLHQPSMSKQSSGQLTANFGLGGSPIALRLSLPSSCLPISPKPHNIISMR